MFETNKILCHAERIAQWLEGKPAPIHLGLCPTDLCPHDCPECNGGRSSENPATLTLEALKEITKQFAQVGGKAVSMVGGGEPLMSHATVAALDYANWIGLSCGLITNGGVLRAGDEDRICSVCDWVRVSWDAGSPEMYRKTHGASADWDTTVRNTERLAGVKNRRAMIGVSYLLSKLTATEAVLAGQVADNVGADYIQFKPFDGDTFDPTETLAEVRRRLPDFTVVGFFQHERPAKRSYHRCHAMNFILEVGADGTMYPCCVFRRQKAHPLGNVLEKPMAEILQSKQFQRLPVAGCPAYCRNHAVNELVQAHYVNPPTHADFV